MINMSLTVGALTVTLVLLGVLVSMIDLDLRDQYLVKLDSWG